MSKLAKSDLKKFIDQIFLRRLMECCFLEYSFLQKIRSPLYSTLLGQKQKAMEASVLISLPVNQFNTSADHSKDCQLGYEPIVLA